MQVIPKPMQAFGIFTRLADAAGTS